MKDYSKIPEYMREGLERYVEHHIEPGSFLRAVLENDFVLAVEYADNANRVHLAEWAETLYTEIPKGCWGSKEKVRNWLDKKED